MHEQFRRHGSTGQAKKILGIRGMSGIQAVADILVGGVQQEIASGGLWGIEDDSDSKYLIEVGEEELSALSSLLEDLGFKPVAIKDAVKQARWEL